jgi:hypothetical protein
VPLFQETIWLPSVRQLFAKPRVNWYTDIPTRDFLNDYHPFTKCLPLHDGRKTDRRSTSRLSLRDKIPKFALGACPIAFVDKWQNGMTLRDGAVWHYACPTAMVVMASGWGIFLAEVLRKTRPQRHKDKVV